MMRFESQGALIGVNAAIIGERPTGLGLYALHVIRALHALDERLLVWTSRPDLIDGQGPRVERVPAALRPERGARGHLLRLLWVQSGLRRRVRRSGADLLLNLMPEGVLLPSVPQIATVHDLLPLFYPAEYPRQQFYFRHYVPAVLRASAAVIVISESTRRDVERLYHVPAHRIHVALCGYDRTRFSPEGEARAGGNYALYVGNVMPHKNLLRLVEAVASASHRVPLRLVIRGSGRRPHVRALQARIERLGLGDRVDWKPYAAPAELPALYRGARMVLLPSLYEGFGLTALEAMACGTPVVASNTSSLPEVVGDAGVLVDPYDTAALADAIARLAEDDRLVKELRERGVARARRFSWDAAAAAVQAAIRGAAAGA